MTVNELAEGQSEAAPLPPPGEIPSVAEAFLDDSCVRCLFVCALSCHSIPYHARLHGSLRLAGCGHAMLACPSCGCRI